MLQVEAKNLRVLEVPAGKKIRESNEKEGKIKKAKKELDDLYYQMARASAAGIEPPQSMFDRKNELIKFLKANESMSTKQLVEAANRKCEMRWKVLAFDPTEDNKLVKEFKDFDCIDCAAAKKREYLEKNPTHIVEIISESKTQKNESRNWKVIVELSSPDNMNNADVEDAVEYYLDKPAGFNVFDVTATRK